MASRVAFAAPSAANRECVVWWVRATPDFQRLFERRRSRAARNGSLFDNFVGAGEQRWRNGNAKHLGGFHVDSQLEPSRMGSCIGDEFAQCPYRQRGAYDQRD